MKIFYTATALDDLAVTMNSSKAFDGDTLSYIPGSAVMGALAAVVYPRCCSTNATTATKSDNRRLTDALFQNGATFFSNCRPLFKDEADVVGATNTSVNGIYLNTYPVPMSLHYSKDDGAKDEKDRRYVNRAVKVDGKDQGVQWKQMRSGFIDSKGNIHKVDLVTSVKTAISVEKQTAKDASLHSREYIRHGQVFFGYVDIADTAWDKANDALKKNINDFFNSEIRVGAGRTAGQSRLKLSTISNPSLNLNSNFANDYSLCEGECSKGADGKTLLYLWCLSDIECMDDLTGMPSLNPEDAINSALARIDADFAGGSSKDSQNTSKLEFLPNSSFVRTTRRRYFNRARGGQDSMVCLIAAGSVLAFKCTGKVPSKETLALLADNGLGCGRQLGLGEVMVNPSWLSQYEVGSLGTLELFKNSCFSKNEKVSLDEVKLHRVSRPKARQNSASTLKKWIDEKLEVHNYYKLDDVAQEFYEKIMELYAHARVFNSIHNSEDCGPSYSQWHWFCDLCYQRKFDDLKKKLDEPKTDYDGWGLMVPAPENLDDNTNANAKPMYFCKAVKLILERYEKSCDYNSDKFKYLLSKTLEKLKESNPATYTTQKPFIEKVRNENTSLNSNRNEVQ